MDGDLFADCKCNIGLYNIVLHSLRSGYLNRTDVPGFVHYNLGRWELEFQVPFAQFLHPSWLALELPEAKRQLLSGMETLLRESATQNGEDNEDEIKEIMAVFKNAVKRLDARQFYYIRQSEWQEMLSNKWLATPGLSSMDANVVAKHVKRLMGNPVGWR
eukprot:TRINITY_DN14193_c0_g1_i1.p1 TRINITY_DN14193_c0_g1~~TRINITY_DN14193_c0_g1_i1.p1  ORF type:complete len:160 (-),score=29.00 TRINITY_DN14193_c0_g1_i1:374-853(-)